MRRLAILALLGGCRSLLGIDEPGATPPDDASSILEAPADAPIDAPHAGCPASFQAVGNSPHVYKLTPSPGPWIKGRDTCHALSPSAYLAIPDDMTELLAISGLAMTPYWVGIDDRQVKGQFVTDKGAVATFLPWAPGEPDMLGDCVEVRSNQYDSTDCQLQLFAICECEP